MNERINELVGQAKFMAEESTNKKISANTELYMFAEKFAELIIRECRVTMSENFHECRTASLMDKVIKEHFGVK
jgi:hypothetical protein